MIKDYLENAEKPTLTDLLRLLFKLPLEKIGQTLHKWGVTPNAITFTGFIGTCVGAVFVALGNLLVGGVLIVVMGGLDALDGAVARAGGESTTFGAFIDSVIDRFTEIAIYAGLAWNFNSVENDWGVILSVIALGGSVLVSYTRARALSLGVETKIGILTRVERMVVIGPAMVFGYEFLGVLLVAVLANFTALQRINHVRKQLDSKEDMV